MLKINSFQNFGGGISDYLAPDLEVLDCSVEHGFAASPTSPSQWDNSINKNLNWGEDPGDDLFY